MRHGRGPPRSSMHHHHHLMPNFAFGPTLSFAATVVLVAVGALVVTVPAAAEEEESESASSSSSSPTFRQICDTGNDDNVSQCTRSYVCIDSRCMCNPMWAHTGDDCSDMTWTSWTLVVVLVLVVLYSVHVLHAAAKRGLSSSTKTWSGLAELASIFFMVKRENDSGDATMRAVIGTAVLESASHVWKILTALGVISDRTSGYWDERVFFPLAEGSYMLPAAIVISVWMDVAKSSMSRVKARKKLRTTKRALEISAASYVLFLLAVCVFGHRYPAMVINLVALGLGMLTCGSGSAKLCNTLRTTGGNNVEIAKKVFRVSRSMGMNFYAMLVGNAMILSSCTRKSKPANLSLLGITISSIGKCLLNKAIFEYACESARAKRDRAALAKRHRRRRSTKPIADMVLSVRALHNTVKQKAALGLQQSKTLIAPVEEEESKEHAPHHANLAGVAGAPSLPFLDSLDESRDKIDGKNETASPCPSTDRADAETSGRKGAASNDDTSWKRSPIGVPGLLGVGRRMSSALCLLGPPSQLGDEVGSNAESTPPPLSIRTRAETNECKGEASED